MKRLSLEEVKSKKAVIQKLQAIKGGNTSDCHAPAPVGSSIPGGAVISA